MVTVSVAKKGEERIATSVTLQVEQSDRLMVESHLNLQSILQLINASNGKPYDTHQGVEGVCFSGIFYAYRLLKEEPNIKVIVEQVSGYFRASELEGFAIASAIAVLTELGQPLTDLVTTDGTCLGDFYSGEWRLTSIEKLE